MTPHDRRVMLGCALYLAVLLLVLLAAGVDLSEPVLPNGG